MEYLKIITVHADPEDSMQPCTQYRDKAKYNGKIDQCESDLHDKTDNEPEKYDKKKWKMDDCFIDKQTKQDDMMKSAHMAKHVKNKYSKVFSGGVGCFKGTVHIDIKKDAEPYQAPPRWVPITLQKPFKAELDRMIKLGIIEPLKIDECSDWCNSYVTEEKSSGDVWMCIDPAKLNCIIVRPIHRGQTVSDILSRLLGATYLFLLDTTSGF